MHAQQKDKMDKTETGAKAKTPALKPFDLNSASEEDLALAGIDKAVAKKIIAARPFKSKDELVSKGLLTKDQYNKVKEMLVAKQPPKTTSKPPSK
jgi:DNA uptake protein ComE-like DNA-binding protein